MGEMVMKNDPDRNGCVLSGLGSKQKKQAIGVLIALAFFFVISAFTFMNFLYCLSDCVGSIVCGSPDVSLRDALRSLPIFLSFFMTLSGLMTVHTFYRNESPDLLRRRAKKHALIGICFGVFIIVYVIIGVISGRYLSITEGAPSALYPLDAVLYSLGSIVFGVCILRYFRKTSEPFSGPSRAPIPKRFRILRCTVRSLWLLIGLYGFCGFFYSFFILDFSAGYQAYTAAAMLVSLGAFLSVAVWELYYNNLTEEKRRAAALPLGLISLPLSAGVMIFYLLALKGNLDGPSNVGFGIIPIAYASGMNVSMVLVVPVPLIVSVTALIKGIYRKAKAPHPEKGA